MTYWRHGVMTGKDMLMSDGDSDLQEVSILPPTVARLVRLGSEIAMEPPTRPDFLHSVLCQVGLPRRRVVGDTFERMNGNVSLLVEAGKLWNGKEWQPQPLPYGTRPRLAWCMSAAKRCARSRLRWKLAIRRASSCFGWALVRVGRSTPTLIGSSGRWPHAA